jgi:tRNA-dihydrouridine synthase B
MAIRLAAQKMFERISTVWKTTGFDISSAHPRFSCQADEVDMEKTVHFQNELSKCLKRPLVIGGKKIGNRLVLSPMTFLGHIAYRELLDRYGGCGLFFSEMCSARRIPHEKRQTSDYFRWRDEETDRLVIQIMGDSPLSMAEAAARIANEGFFGVDINFGCSASSIRRIDCGAALLKTPKKAAAIVKAVRHAVRIPVFVKFRIGWKDDPRIPLELARRFEDAGADALTFHPRIAPDRRLRPPRWDYIRQVKNAVTIPVFGNGDVFTAADCTAMLRDTGCDGVAIGRIAIARPWIFSKWVSGIDPPPEIFRSTAFDLLTLLEKHYETRKALRRFRRFIAYYAGNFHFGHTLNSTVAASRSGREIRFALTQFFDLHPDTKKKPNMIFFT